VSCALREQSWRADRRSRRRLWIFPTSSIESEPTNPASQPSLPFPPRGASLVSVCLSVCLSNAVSLPSPHPHTTGRWDSELRSVCLSVSGPDYLDSRGGRETGRERESVTVKDSSSTHSLSPQRQSFVSLREVLWLSRGGAGRGGAEQERAMGAVAWRRTCP
jgi:hypothetical protein